MFGVTIVLKMSFFLEDHCGRLNFDRVIGIDHYSLCAAEADNPYECPEDVDENNDSDPIQDIEA